MSGRPPQVAQRGLVLAMVLAQVLVPTVLLVHRAVTQGWYPTSNHPYGWQVYSSVDADALCRLRDRCD